MQTQVYSRPCPVIMSTSHNYNLGADIWAQFFVKSLENPIRKMAIRHESLENHIHKSNALSAKFTNIYPSNAVVYNSWNCTEFIWVCIPAEFTNRRNRVTRFERFAAEEIDMNEQLSYESFESHKQYEWKSRPDVKDILDMKLNSASLCNVFFDKLYAFVSIFEAEFRLT